MHTVSLQCSVGLLTRVELAAVGFLAGLRRFWVSRAVGGHLMQPLFDFVCGSLLSRPDDFLAGGAFDLPAQARLDSLQGPLKLWLAHFPFLSLASVGSGCKARAS